MRSPSWPAQWRWRFRVREVVEDGAGRPPAVVNDGHGDYVYVPAGSFHMGDNFGDGEARERPAHVVDLDAFYIGKYEMTNAEWRVFRDDPGYDDTKFWPGGRVVPKNQNSYWTNASQHGGGTPDSDGYPLQGVNWDAAAAYCNWLSAKTGKKYRLPTEAEWEKAARGTDQRQYPWGNTIDHSYANFTGGFNFGTLAGFYDGSKRGDLQTHSNASPYGAFDMAGNVMEWCQDWYSRELLRVLAAQEPEGAGERLLSRGARRKLLPGSAGPADLRPVGRMAVGSGAPYVGIPGSAGALARFSGSARAVPVRELTAGYQAAAALTGGGVTLDVAAIPRHNAPL